MYLHILSNLILPCAGMAPYKACQRNDETTNRRELCNSMVKFLFIVCSKRHGTKIPRDKELSVNKLRRFRGIFAVGQESGIAAYSVLRKVTLTQPSGKKTRKVRNLFTDSSYMPASPSLRAPYAPDRHNTKNDLRGFFGARQGSRFSA